MAFTKTPTASTESTKMIPLSYKWDIRGGPFSIHTGSDYDAAARNVIFEPVTSQATGENYQQAYKRDGVSAVDWATNITPPSVINSDFGVPVIGVYSSTSTPYTLVVTAATVYVLGPATVTGGDVARYASGSAGGPYYAPLGFSDFVYDNGDPAVFMAYTNNSELVKISLIGGAFAISSSIPALVGPHNGDPTTLDGYLFLSHSDGSIYNSNLNDPLTWSSSNFITAESYGDKLIRIARSGSYIVAFGQDSVEFFYDAANPSGSPLSVYPGATKRIGYLGGLAQLGDTLYFIGKTTNGTPSLYKVSGLKVEEIADFSQARTLQYNFSSSFTNGTGNILFMNGHTLYSWHSASNDAFPITFDLTTSLFTSLSFKQTDLDLVQSTSIRFSSGLINTAFCRESDSKLYYYDPTVYQDDGANYTVFLQTKNEDFDTRRNKFGSRALLHTDQTTASSTCLVSYTIDDYKTWSLDRVVDLVDTYPRLHALGQFRKIAFRITYTDNFPMRFGAVELDYDLGGQ